MNKRILLFFIPLLAVLLVVTGTFVFFHLQQKASLEDLSDELDRQKTENEELIAEIDRLFFELNQLQEHYDHLLREKEDLEEGRTGDPGRGNDPGTGSPGGSGPVAYLTIDDGPSKNTLQILEILRGYGIPATFFVTGNNYSGEAGIYRRILDEGHVMGNHTYSHNFEQIYLSVNDFINDFIRFEEFIKQETGCTMDIMRFPGGTGSQMARSVSGYDIVEDLIPAVQALGYDYFDWNIYCGDGDTSTPSVTLVENVVNQVNRHGGNIVVLLHDGRNNEATVEALPQIIDFLKTKGYQFATLHKGAINVKHR